MAHSIYIYDAIGEDSLGGGVKALDIVEALAEAGGATVDLHINSPGGSVFEGHAIYNALASYAGPVHVYIDGLAASAASFVALAGDRVSAAKNALIMIHEPWAVAVGDSADMLQMSLLLEKMSGTLSAIYTEKTGMSDEETRAAMKAETWLTAAEWGLVDHVITSEDRPAKIAASAVKSYGYTNTPQEIIEADSASGDQPSPQAEYAEEKPGEEATSRLSVHHARLTLLTRKA